ncbi:DUF262 domain-containing protein [Arsenophonus sp. aPb]|uniref:DUF262 domain-containing protein n=1 Tax=Arsenophonus sp. aPb TaxID=3041619 RepID=UPI002469B4B9|nr:DUF262 domain-containing protein [Arsenophonus sp. aPb]WGL99172.1 DUF262 domain-containing protein [Arsenophonus sp. aPb]
MTINHQYRNHVPKNPDEKMALDEQIRELEKITDHEIREFPISVIVDKFQDGLKEDKAELFIPDYQREYIWDIKQKSRFIESLLLKLPIPYLFVADVNEGENAGRIEIVDGSQRIRTLHAFLNDKFALVNLKKLPSANGFKFSDFSNARRLRFARKTIRMIELTEYCDEETRREIFDRLNSGGTKLTTMEQRKGRNDGAFLTFIDNLSKLELFHSICPITEARRKRSEYLELILRYFAYSDRYLEFEKSVDDFLTSYLINKNMDITNDHNKTTMEQQFKTMCNFINTHFPGGFRKTLNATTVPRIRFEALAVGTTLALRVNPDLIPVNIESWINSETFIKHTRSDASNSRPKVKARIEYVRDMLLDMPNASVQDDDSEE